MQKTIVFTIDELSIHQSDVDWRIVRRPEPILGINETMRLILGGCMTIWKQVDDVSGVFRLREDETDPDPRRQIADSRL